jgi:hypothetical protein
MSIDSKRLNRSQKSSYLVCRDIIELKDDMNNDDYELICSILFGDYWTQYNNLTNEQIKLEFEDMLAMIDEYKKEMVEKLFIQLFPDEVEKPPIDFSVFANKKLKKSLP